MDTLTCAVLLMFATTVGIAYLNITCIKGLKDEIEELREKKARNTQWR